MKSLIAKWKPGADPVVEAPTEIRWSDDSPATLQDFVDRLDVTHRIDQDEDGGCIRTCWSGIVADVRFDRGISAWVCQAPGHCEVLDELVPEASDEEIVAALYTFPIVYRAVIRRD